MKIGIVCSEGGHLIEALNMIDAFKGHDIFLVTYDAKHMPARDIMNKNISRIYKLSYSVSNPMLFLKLGALGIPKIFKVFLKERPDVLFSTGSEIAVPAFVIGKWFFKTRLIFLETLTKIDSSSLTGRFLYRMCDKFIVPWRELVKVYGKKADFIGEVI